MVIESLINPAKAEGRPWEMFFLGLLYASIAVFLSLWIFKDYSSLVMVFLTVFASIPVVYSLIAMEEEKDVRATSEKSLSVDFDLGFTGERIKNIDKCNQTIQKLKNYGYIILHRDEADISFKKIY